MKRTNATNVVAAFDLLLDEVESEVAVLNRLGSAAFAEGQHERAAQILRRVEAVTAFRSKLNALRKEWEALGCSGGEHESQVTPARLARGLRTREEAYFRPILQTLIDLGGRAPMGDVLARVHQAMKDRLSKVDYDGMPSDARTPRWRKTAQWARMALVEQGLIKRGSPRGVWEISEEGRDAVARGAV